MKIEVKWESAHACNTPHAGLGFGDVDLTQRWPAGQPLVDIVGMVVAKMTVAVVGVVSPGKLCCQWAWWGWEQRNGSKNWLWGPVDFEFLSPSALNRSNKQFFHLCHIECCPGLPLNVWDGTFSFPHITTVITMIRTVSTISTGESERGRKGD